MFPKLHAQALRGRRRTVPPVGGARVLFERDIAVAGGSTGAEAGYIIAEAERMQGDAAAAETLIAERRQRTANRTCIPVPNEERDSNPNID